MIAAVIRALGVAGAAKSISGGGEGGQDIGTTIKSIEQTETGKYALTMAKGTVTAILIIVGLGAFMFIRTSNRIFGEQKKQMAAAQNVNIKTRLFDYYKGKHPEKSDAEIMNEVNLVL